MGNASSVLNPPIHQTYASVLVNVIFPLQEGRQLCIDMVGIQQDVNVNLINGLDDWLEKSLRYPLHRQRWLLDQMCLSAKYTPNAIDTPQPLARPRLARVDGCVRRSLNSQH